MKRPLTFTELPLDIIENFSLFYLVCVFSFHIVYLWKNTAPNVREHLNLQSNFNTKHS